MTGLGVAVSVSVRAELLPLLWPCELSAIRPNLICITSGIVLTTFIRAEMICISSGCQLRVYQVVQCLSPLRHPFSS
ncbi:uncharacterized protein LY79DRAFT_11939 [Colletotrichum navitas]|uniref:Uncharacterized protein n=1 Tax=Colletotrichum navitas TaxID=681940 RepID=A0AAD8QFL8_9PEZI|nr:uncharacterized protein LY79DRAFT_11939 [Colletotrichum navitas]KAK1600239.1 hypothetical protein LY79DRAFT_11939 [Colletotrichum navitas]